MIIKNINNIFNKYELLTGHRNLPIFEFVDLYQFIFIGFLDSLLSLH